MKSVWQRIAAWAPAGIATIVALDVLVGVYYRFTTTSKLWLDEALSVNIARHGFSQIVGLLRHDGAPPLYYFLLHVWMGLFGHGDAAVRALSGLFSVLTLVVVYFLARQLLGARNAWLAVAVVAVVPYAVYFGTETRMYSLVMLEVSALLWTWLSTSADRPQLLRVVVIAMLSAALLYTHYWSLYLLAVLAGWALVGLMRQRGRDRQARQRLAGIAAGFVLWAPWLSIFNEQRIHTGTPWSAPPNYYQLFTWLDSFTVNQSVQHVTPSLHTQIVIMLFVGLVILGVFALPMRDGLRLTLDGKVPRAARFVSVVGVATVVLGLLAARFAHTTYVPRYAAVAAIPLFLVVVRGMVSFEKPIRILIVLIIFSVASLWTDRWGAHVQRTQAGRVAHALEAAPANARVLVCPDQLGPSLLRYAPVRLSYVGYPRMESPEIVNWYDYKKAFSVNPISQAASTFVASSKGSPLYVVWASGYTLHGTCKDLVHRIETVSGLQGVNLVTAKLTGFYQSMNLTELVALPN